MGLVRQHKIWTTAPPLGRPLNRSHNLSQGLVGKWLLNEGGGKLAVDSYKQNNGTCTAASWAVGQRGNAHNFTGANMITANTQDSATPPVTITAWVRPSTIVAAAYSICYIGASGNEVGILQLTTNFWALSQSATGINFQATGATTIVAGNWYFVCGVFASATSRSIYVNGYLDGTNTTSAATSGTTGVRIGNRFNIDQYNTGLIMDVNIYKRALSASEVRQIYQNTYQMFM